MCDIDVLTFITVKRKNQILNNLRYFNWILCVALCLQLYFIKILS